MESSEAHRRRRHGKRLAEIQLPKTAAQDTNGNCLHRCRLKEPDNRQHGT
jgi:hypothetical protein